MALVGTLRTENLGIERLLRNVLANPHVRVLVLCGDDARQAVGHLPGQSLASLFASGVDASGRILGAMGRRPVLKNVTREQVSAFLRQVSLVPMIGEEREDAVRQRVAACAVSAPGPFAEAPPDTGVEVVNADEPRRLALDPAGFFVVYPDVRRRRLVVEHYTNAGVLHRLIEGASPAAVAAAAIEKGLVSRLDHAAYLGRELARAERSLATGEPYVQDRAPGEITEDSASALAALPRAGCGCADVCATGEVEG
jgi:tetrahydromethanopterin S-methyltransferase subunit A